MTNEILDTLQRRRSVRSYQAKQIGEGSLCAVLEAGRCTPYAGRPVHITVVQDTGLIGKINIAAKHAAMHMGMPHLEQLGSDPDFVGSYGAPTLIIVSDQAESVSPELNCAAAVQNMLIAAESLGLGACWVHFPLFFAYGPQAEEICSDLKLPDGHKLCACIALGYKAADAEAGEREYSKITRIE